MKTRFILLALILNLSGCISPKKTHSITDLLDTAPGMGAFDGIEKHAEPIESDPTRKKITILYMHGIGWSQETLGLAGEFKSALQNYYGFGTDRSVLPPSNLCPNSRSRGEVSEGGLRIKASDRNGVSEVSFETDLSGHNLWLTEIGCIDRQILNEGGQLEFHLYRLFWDDAFWSNLQFPHLGYDDALQCAADFVPLGTRCTKGQNDHQHIYAKRKGLNRELKDSLVTFGLSDAAMYLGPAGEYIRKAVRTSICVVATDTNDKSSRFIQGSNASEANPIPPSNACSLGEETNPKLNKVTFISESLGSRVLFDVLRSAHFNDEPSVLSHVVEKEPTAYLLANQIALIGLGRLTETNWPKNDQTKSLSKKPKVTLVAFSELNDLLTYEIIPYAEQLWIRSAKTKDEMRKRTRSMLNASDSTRRQDIAKALGFNVIDVRLEFAKTLFPSFADPDDAHRGMSKHDFITRMIFCGAENNRAKGTKNSCD